MHSFAFAVCALGTVAASFAGLAELLNGNVKDCPDMLLLSGLLLLGAFMIVRHTPAIVGIATIVRPIIADRRMISSRHGWPSSDG